MAQPPGRGLVGRGIVVAVDRIRARQGEGALSLERAVLDGDSRGLVELLVEGGDVNAAVSCGRPLLSIAVSSLSFASQSSVDVVEVLLCAGCSLVRSPTEREGPLLCALTNPRFCDPIGGLLVDCGADIAELTETYCSPFSPHLSPLIACQDLDPAVTSLFLCWGEIRDLHKALGTYRQVRHCVSEDLEYLELFLQAGASLDCSRDALCNYARQQNEHPEILVLLEVLLLCGADPNVPCGEGCLPIENADDDAAHVLLRAGADVTLLSPERQEDRLRWAVWTNQVELSEELLRRGTIPDVSEGISNAFDVAFRNNQYHPVARVLWEYGATPSPAAVKDHSLAATVLSSLRQPVCDSDTTVDFRMWAREPYTIS